MIGEAFHIHVNIVTICKRLINWDYPWTAYENESLFLGYLCREGASMGLLCLSRNLLEYPVCCVKGCVLQNYFQNGKYSNLALDALSAFIVHTLCA